MAELLEGIRVLDLSTNVAGPFATKLLADHGAEVLKVEPPGGDPSRFAGPFPDDVPHPEKSALFLHLNTNKRSVTLDLQEADSRAIIRRLAAVHDIVVEDFAPGRMSDWGLDWDELSRDRSDLVLASITPFGQYGPYRDYRGSEITLQAMGGPLHLNGSADREPNKLGGNVAHYHAGAATALAIMLARLRVEMGGPGDHIDLAVYECQAGFRDRRTPYLMASSYTGMAARRQPAGSRVATGVRPCLDGYVNILAGGPRYLGPFLRYIGQPELADSPELNKVPTEMDPDVVAEIEAAYLGWTITRTKREVLEETQALGILGGAILTIEDLANDPHYRERGVWETVEHPVAGTIEYPGRQLILSGTPRKPATHAPLLGEHQAEIESLATSESTGGN